jgi:hypothetical protein
MSRDASLNAGSPENAGPLCLNDKQNLPRVRPDAGDASLQIGGSGQGVRVYVKNSSSVNMVTIDGETGNLVLTNADCVEEFDVESIENAASGTLMVRAEDMTLSPLARSMIAEWSA